MWVAPRARAGDTPGLIGQSALLRQLVAQLEGLSRRACTVLLCGETGTGKELAARWIHAQSPRAGKPFVPVDCTTLGPTLMDSQLFGHVRGAFTGADRATLGFFRAANSGTLFLDEIGELSLPSQAKLLRCIQEREVVPLGAAGPISVDVRLIAATHRELAEMVSRGEFRQDLFYRLNVATVHLPALRQHKDDIPLLVRHALRELAEVYQEPPRRITDAARRALVCHSWPGNVRELINAIEHAMVFSPPDQPIDVCDLPDEVRSSGATPAQMPTQPTTLASAERQLIAATLRACGGNQASAARSLAMERHRLHRRIVRYELLDLLHSHARHS